MNKEALEKARAACQEALSAIEECMSEYGAEESAESPAMEASEEPASGSGMAGKLLGSKLAKYKMG